MFPLFPFSSRADLTQIVKSKIIWPNWRGRWILGRHACLGRDVFDLVDCDFQIFNIQKGRVDHLISSLQKPCKRTKSVIVSKFLSRNDISPLLRQQEYCGYLPKHSPQFIYMDSFSELVDQFFVHREEQWGCCCCYSDLNHTEAFKASFKKMGLLDINSIELNYRLFFDFIKRKYGEVPILFLHFPSVLESRLKYVERADVIYRVIEKIAKEHPSLYSISVENHIVSEPIKDKIKSQDFPYHYNDEVYHSFADKINQILHEIKLQSESW